MMDILARSNGRMQVILVFAGGLLVAGIALALAIHFRDAASHKVSVGLPLSVMGAIVLGALLAWIARHLWIGPSPNIPATSRWTRGWIVSRLVLLIATFTLFVGWLLALASGHSLQLAFLGAFLNMIVVTGLSGIIGEAVWNSALVVGRLRSPHS